MKFEKTSIVKCPEGIQLHHIFAKGTNEEIGYQLGRLANDFHNIDKSANINASIVEGQYSYLKKHYPGHYARMSGFAKAYKKRLNDYSYDFSFFGNALNGPACSAVHYPPAITISNRGYISRNLDFTIPKNPKFDTPYFPFQHTHILEMHPESSYPSISLFCFEVFGLALEGINSQGLVVIHLADADTRIDHENLATKQTKKGFNEFLPIQYLLDTCSTAKEAARALKKMAHYHVAIPVHLLIADKHGESFVFEYSFDGSRKVFVQGEATSPLKVTNFQLNRLSDSTMRKVIESRFDENGFDRYRILEKLLDQTQFPISEESIQKINSAVYVSKETVEHFERSLFHSIYDTSSCAVKICPLPNVTEAIERFFSISLNIDHRTNAFT
jgi:predicted choloylglycine hydrolase